MTGDISIAVVGAGAIGGVLAAALGDCGRHVTLCDRVPFDRLTLVYEGERRTYGHPMVTSPHGLGPVDWVLLCTKAHQVAGASPWLENLAGPESRIAVMQNGIDHEKRVDGFAPAERVVPAIMLLPAAVLSPGEVEQQREGTIQVPDTAAGRDFAALFSGQDQIAINPVEDFLSAAWAKLAFNAVGGGIGCLALQPLRSLGDPSVKDLAYGMFEEVMAVGRAEGAIFPEDFIEQTIVRFSGRSGGHYESIAVDRMEGRRMEWQVRNAIVGEKGRAHGIPTPLNDAVTALLALIDKEMGEARG